MGEYSAAAGKQRKDQFIQTRPTLARRDSFHEVKELAMRVLETAIKDYKIVCAAREPILRVDGLLVIRDASKASLESFFTEGYAQFYLDLSGAYIEEAGLFRSLKKEIKEMARIARNGRLFKVENKGRKFGANKHYIFTYLENSNGDNETPYLFTENELKDAENRANKNPEDLLEKNRFTDWLD